MITTDSGTFTAFTVYENTETTVVIKTYMATDVDADTTLTWSLEGNDAGAFTITKNPNGTASSISKTCPTLRCRLTLNDE